MSMLSGQADRLQESANNLERYGFADFGENRHDLIRELRDAADTIWSLRNLNVDVQAENDDLKAENANLRERITTQKQTIQAYRDESREWREVAERVQAENAKLRRLVTGLKYCSSHPTCTIHTGKTCPLRSGENYECEELERELGIEGV